jgi:hypothetical protein
MKTNQKLQKQISTGNWIDVDETEASRIVEMAMQKYSATFENIMKMVEAKPGLNYDTDTRETAWYMNFRIKPEPRQPRPVDYPDGRRLDCGCLVYDRAEIMSASLGSSCPDCYDRMS